MIQMVQHINADWQAHVAERASPATPATAATRCRRTSGSTTRARRTPSGMAETGDRQEHRRRVGRRQSSLPYDPFTPFLEKRSDIRVQVDDGAAGTDRQSIKQTEWTYALMIHFSQSLGVNCTYCHNTPVVRRLVAEHAAAGDRLVRHPDGAGPQQRLPGHAAGRVPGVRRGPMDDVAEGQLRHLPPGCLQAAVWRQHGADVPGAEGTAAAVRARPPRPPPGRRTRRPARRRSSPRPRRPCRPRCRPNRRTGCPPTRRRRHRRPPRCRPRPTRRPRRPSSWPGRCVNRLQPGSRLQPAMLKRRRWAPACCKRFVANRGPSPT